MNNFTKTSWVGLGIVLGAFTMSLFQSDPNIEVVVEQVDCDSNLENRVVFLEMQNKALKGVITEMRDDD